MTTRHRMHPCPYLLCAGLALLAAPALAMDPEPTLKPSAATAPPAETAPAVAAPSGAASASSSAAAVDVPMIVGRAAEEGSLHSVGINLKSAVRKQEAAKGRTVELGSFDLNARPAMAPGHRMVGLGTNDPESDQHFVMLVDLDRMAGSRSAPLVDYLKVPHHLCDSLWLDDNNLLCASGKGHLDLYHYHGAKQKLEAKGTMKQAAGSYIREMAAQPGSSTKVVIGGFDQKVNMLDLCRPDNAYVQRLDLQGVIGSLRWSPLGVSAPHVFSLTLDEGKYYSFDTRAPIKDTVFYLNVKKHDLYTHEQFSDYGVLLGFGDGQIKLFDLRVANRVRQTIQDAYVDSIGGIEFEATSKRLLTSGDRDYSQYVLEPDDGWRYQSHSVAGPESLRGKGWSCYSIFASPDEVLTASSAGGLQLDFLEPRTQPETDPES